MALLSKLDLALNHVSRGGQADGRRVGDVWFRGGDRGQHWVRWTARCVIHPTLGYRDAARRGAARALLEVVEPPATDELATRDLDDELLCIAALLRGRRRSDR